MYSVVDVMMDFSQMRTTSVLHASLNMVNLQRNVTLKKYLYAMED